MGKMVMVEGVPHRVRRGKLVPIPPEWLGRVVTKETRRHRQRVHRVIQKGPVPSQAMASVRGIEAERRAVLVHPDGFIYAPPRRMLPISRDGRSATIRAAIVDSSDDA